MHGRPGILGAVAACAAAAGMAFSADGGGDGGSAARPWVLEAYLEPDPGPPPGLLGPAVALSARRAAVGAGRNHDTGRDSASVHCYDMVTDGWALRQVLQEPQGAVAADYGAALAMDGDHLIVGAPRDSEGAFEAGRVHVYARSARTWKLSQTLEAAEPQVAAAYGAAVAVDRRVLAVGSPRRDVAGSQDAGAVDVFEQDGRRWRRAATLTAPVPDTSAWFGSAVAVQGDLLAVGAHGHHAGGSAAGQVHLFRRAAEGGWTLQATLTPPWPGPAWFGYSLALDRDSLLVGAPRAERPGRSPGVSAGAAFLFERRGAAWIRTGVLAPHLLEAGDGFGVAVAISQEWAVVGATGDDEFGEDAGAVFVHRRRGGAGVGSGETLSIPVLSEGDHVGAALAFVRGRLLVGRGGNPERDPLPGAAYLYASPGLGAPPPTSPTRPPGRQAG